MDMTRLKMAKWHMRIWKERMTWPWLAAGGLLAFGTGFYFSIVYPAQSELESMRRNLSDLQEEVRLAESHKDKLSQLVTPTQLAAFYQFFPSERSIPDWIEKISAIAAGNGLKLRQAEYQVIRDKTGRLLFYQITLPVKGSYPDLRSFIEGVLAAVPFASLDNVKFERQKIGDEDLVGTLQITLHLGRES